MIINLHIGFPKTATTTLQNAVFPNYSGVTYLGKKQRDEDTDVLVWKSLNECWDRYASGRNIEAPLDAWLQAIIDSGAEKLLLSDEALMEWPSPRLTGTSRWLTETKPKVDQLRSGPHPVNDFLSMIKQRLPNRCELRAIITLRNQSDLMGSLAAQTGHRDPHFVERVLATQDPSLEFHRIVRDVQATLGGANVLVLLYEDGLIANSKKISEFVGADIATEPSTEFPKLNVKGAGLNTWRTRRAEPIIIERAIAKIRASASGSAILDLIKRRAPWVVCFVPRFRRAVRISYDQRKRIQSHFKQDNDELSDLVGRDLRPLGY